MSETHEATEGSTIARYIARFRQAQPRAPEERRRTPREEFWWVQPRLDADNDSGLSRKSVEDEDSVPKPNGSASVVSSSLSSWRTLDQSHEEAQVVSPEPVLPASTAPVLQETAQAARVDVKTDEYAPSIPDLYGSSEEEEQVEDDEDAESVIQRVRERLGWHGSSSSRSSMSLSSSLFASPFANADMDSVASSFEASAASSSAAELDGSIARNQSIEPAMSADLRNRWPEEEDEEKASLVSASSSSQGQQAIPSHALQINSTDETEDVENGCTTDDALAEKDHHESMPEETKEEEVLTQGSAFASLVETHGALELLPSLAPSKSPVPMNRSSDTKQSIVQRTDIATSSPRRSASSSSSSRSNTSVQEAATTVDSSGKTTAETAQTLDRLVSFVVQSWSKDLFDSDDLYETSPIVSNFKEFAASTDISPASDHKDDESTRIDGSAQDVSIVQEPQALNGVTISQVIDDTTEIDNSDVLVVSKEDEEPAEEDHVDDDDEFGDDEVVCMLRQRIALYEEALRRIEHQ